MSLLGSCRKRPFSVRTGSCTFGVTPLPFPIHSDIGPPFAFLPVSCLASEISGARLFSILPYSLTHFVGYCLNVLTNDNRTGHAKGKQYNVNNNLCYHTQIGFIK